MTAYASGSSGTSPIKASEGAAGTMAAGVATAASFGDLLASSLSMNASKSRSRVLAEATAAGEATAEDLIAGALGGVVMSSTALETADLRALPKVRGVDGGKAC